MARILDPTLPVSPFFIRHLEQIRAASALGPILDLACGSGRHALTMAHAGAPCIGVDRNSEDLETLRQHSARMPLTCVRADLETEYGLPFVPGSFGAILVFRFLYRPLAEPITDALAPGGLLVYETFTHQQAALTNGPKSNHFLLEKSELRTLFPKLSEIDYEEGWLPDARQPHYLARLAARKPAARKPAARKAR